MITIIFH